MGDHSCKNRQKMLKHQGKIVGYTSSAYAPRKHLTDGDIGSQVKRSIFQRSITSFFTNICNVRFLMLG